MVLVAGCERRAATLRPQPITSPQALDDGEIAVDSAPAREWIGKERIRVRRGSTNYRPTGKIALLRAEEPTDQTCRATLINLVRRFDSGAKIYYMRDVLAAKSDRAVIWVNRGSGSFKYVRADASHAIRSNIPKEQAIQIALDFLGKNHLIQRSSGEEIDLVGVSEVMNRVTRAGETEPLEEFRSDYYVGFGRRFNGIPVIGSRLVVRVDGKGDVAMVEGYWRRIAIQRLERVETRSEALEELLAGDVDLRKRPIAAPIPRSKITVLDAKCGYLAAPADYVQDRLRPGCRVLYRAGNRANEEPSWITIPLEKGVAADAMLGSTVKQGKLAQVFAS